MSVAENADAGLEAEQYTKGFAEHWDDLVGWDSRLSAEGGFYEDLLKRHGCRDVADVAAGTGVNAVALARAGFNVTASDGSANMMAKTKENAGLYEVRFADTAVVDWNRLAQELGEKRFDAVVCLGNAFTHLFDHELRRESLRSMFEVLRPGGMLVVDQRNYDSMLDNGYSSKHEYYYTGQGVDVGPVELNDRMARFEYRFPNGRVFQLKMFPLRQAYLTELLEDAGFKGIQRYGDFEKPYDLNDVDFIQQVAFRPAN